jgi:peptidoglycan/LPS O-acetylase OafA/YrhL
MEKGLYFKGLNGIRAIAALAVVISHINNRLDYFFLPKLPLLDLANFGVTIFFTLSGFLITYLLLEEKEKTGTIALKKFYWRRILRIWPLYFLYLIIVVVFNDPLQLNWSILFFVFMIPNFRNSFKDTINIYPGNHNLTYMIGHYWSLGVEEQFYLFWPVLVRKLKSIFVFALLFPLFFIFFKLILKITHAPNGVITFFHYTRLGCLVIGGLGAFLVKHNYNKIITYFTNPLIEVFCWMFLLLILFNQFHIASLLDHEIVAVITLGIIINQIKKSNPIVNLEKQSFDFLGKISFGLYVYNPLVIYITSLLINSIEIDNLVIKYVLIYALSLALLILVAYCSYHFFEKRFLKLKNRYTVIQSHASKIAV